MAFTKHSKTELLTRDVPIDTQERFWSKVQKTDSCWTWIGARNKKGYGHFSWRKMGRPHLAHRFVLMLTGINIPEGMLVMHTCDNRACVNPDHLRMGTAANNSQDMVVKGRSRRGESNQVAKLKEREVIEIKNLYASGGYSQKTLAQRYGVSASSVSAIILGRNWKYTTETQHV